MNFSIMFDKEKCRGCTNCMKKCPTQAIRIKNGKAIIDHKKCIHCGECIRACSYGAYSPECIEWKNETNAYKCKIAIPSTTIYGQFPRGTDICVVQNAILKLGFDYVYDESWAAELVAKAIKKKIDNNKDIRPFINTNCPATLRLINIRYPSLTENLIALKTPMEIAGILARNNARKKFNLEDKDIGVFYITPCPAKLLAVTDPIGNLGPSVDWVIPLNKIYGELYQKVVKEDNLICSYPSLSGLKWSVCGGQSKSAKLTNFIAVNGMENVIQILEEIENGKLSGVDYVEVLACVQGCVGGTFNVINPFIASSNNKYILNTLDGEPINSDLECFEKLYNKGFFEFEFPDTESVNKINIKEALKKNEEIKQILAILPGLDCGSCGSPTCLSHAEDIYNGQSTIFECVVLRANS
ncbi:[Fe-Fe] hydrogenase large subunit C-terminal domain-containing protein [Sedimentibacter sp. MB31-C6]|uniref:[Fe-Fe] hydrogenase large subunit C-terminal domain-containing protein n=1 Tax=Sedimentibacter sp. MB31-C6 TaxID=3109366 RepID=UPI002DDCBE76|nr:[Fe-Fe] hydrogenase large subunit C-terminal domain-containing protein [Sedimentibacter sp. MB36-C1]WSI04374.1 [Fe-Fe] hydrogenase large subunit C-terminal domain-containing protein [Sedimentibacter sp. MB36-C1]